MSEVNLIELRKKFQGEIDQADWEMLAPILIAKHFLRSLLTSIFLMWRLI